MTEAGDVEVAPEPRCRLQEIALPNFPDGTQLTAVVPDNQPAGF
jgi:hypothetical protein